jgi:putative transposase
MNNTCKKRVRLKAFDYKGHFRYSTTLCTHNRAPLFKDPSTVIWLTGILKVKSEEYGFRVWAYCFMPDHLHLLIEGKSPDSDMKRFLSAFKQLSGFYYKKETGLPLWQINFYEHVLRNEENTISVAQYIFNNPVRKGLVADYRKYRFLGSFEFDIMQT